jgi:hypothetical protein
MSQEDNNSGKDKGKQFHFFVDGTKYETEHASLTGADIKRIAGVTATYQLFLEAEDESPDVAVSDGEGIDLHKTKHFYAVPPATFGA